MTNPTPTLPVRHFAYIIEGTEYERGWGCRPDGVVAFLDEGQASEWIKAYDKKWNNEDQDPHEYTTYSKIGFKEVSKSTMEQIVEKGQVHAHRLSELQ